MLVNENGSYGVYEDKPVDGKFKKYGTYRNYARAKEVANDNHVKSTVKTLDEAMKDWEKLQAELDAMDKPKYKKKSED